MSETSSMSASGKPAKRTIIVVPCFNEARRLDLPRFEVCLEREPGVEIIFVDDGSRDATLDLLRSFEATHPRRVSVLDLQPNRGKAAAVRDGMRAAFEAQPDFVGYWDADLATPLDEIPLFRHVLEEREDLLLAIGSRVKLLGRSIERGMLRHYLGRVAATLASMVLKLEVYDTQCGAKLFRATPETRALFEEPFATGWVFDVEMLARLVRDRRRRGASGAENVIYEIPLQEWHDIAGSKLVPGDFFRAFLELGKIYRRYTAPSAVRQNGNGR